jgi:uncharacterized protein (DUF58 family)
VSEAEEPAGATSLVVLLPSILVLAVAFIVAAAKGATAPAAFAATTLAFAAAMRAWGRLALVRTEARLSCDHARLYAGELLVLRAEIENRKPLPIWVRLELSRSPALAAASPGGIEGEAGLRPYERIEGSWTFRAERRGVHRLGPAALEAGDLLGFHRKSRKLPFRQDIVVFPRLLPLAEPDLPFLDFFGIDPTKGLVEDPARYEGTREYTGNKPAKNIHWKASARLNVLQEKLFEPTSHAKLFLVLDGRGFAEARDEAGFERALEAAASLASLFAEKGASIAIATDREVLDFPTALPLGRGPEHLGTVLEFLARCGLGEGRDPVPLPGDLFAAGAGFLVIARAPEARLGKYSGLLAAGRRDRLRFLFAADEGDAAVVGHPSLRFSDLSRADGATR